MIKEKTVDDLRGMKMAGEIVAITIQDLVRAIDPDHTTTEELDQLADKLLKERGARVFIVELPGGYEE